MIATWRWLVLLMLLPACGGAQSDDDQDGGAPYCAMSITIGTPVPQVGDTVDLDGSMLLENLSGVQSFEFSVTFGGEPVTVDERDPFDGSRVSFVPAAAGPYSVLLGGSVTGGGFTDFCNEDDLTFNVTDPNAASESFRFRFLPAAGQPAPAQERTFEIFGGADFDVGSIGLDNGVPVSGSVQDGVGGGVAGYLRISPSGGTGEPVDAFADAAGAFATRIAAGNQDVLVVPEDGALAPAALTDQSPSALASLIVPDGDAITGTVLDAAGDPLAGAQVTLRIGGVPSTTGVTSAAGAFAVLAHPGGATAITVTPPAASGLPRLELPDSAGLTAAAGTPLTIRYAAGWTSRAVSLGLRQSNGSTAAPGASVLWIAGPLAAAGTVTPQAGAPLAAAGSVRLSAVADGGGQVAGLILPETGYSVVVVPAQGATGQYPRLAAVDLSTGSPTPATLSLAAAATVTGQVTGGGAALAGAEVHASPRGLLANLPQASASATTGAPGTYSLSLVGGGDYELLVSPRTRTSARARITTVAPAAGAAADLGATDLPAAIRVSGRVTITGVTSAAGVAVEVYCTTCTGSAALVPVAEAVTDATGRFVVSVPDPGLDGP